MSSGKPAKTLVGAKFDDEEAARIDERWRAMGLGDRSAYIRKIIAADLRSGDPPDLRATIEAALAPAVYVLLSCSHRVTNSEQALAVVERVLLSGGAAGEISEFLTRDRTPDGPSAEGTER